MRWLWPVLALVLFATAARADGTFRQCWTPSKNSVAFKACLAALKRDVDRDLESALADAETTLAQFDALFGGNRATRSLARTQKSFELYDDLDCVMHGYMASPDSVGPAFSPACWIDRSRERIAILAELRRVSAAEALAGVWVMTDIGGEGVPASVSSRLKFDEDGKVSGHGGCNTFFGSVSYGEETLKFGPIGGTRMACGETVDGQELRFKGALLMTRRWSFDIDGELVLKAADDRPLVRLRRAE